MSTPDPAGRPGLSDADAAARLARDGYNELAARENRPFSAIVGGVVREPMFLLLVGAGLIYFVLGDLEEGALLLSFVIVVIGITVYQERKSERALEALRSLASPRALVVRDGAPKRIPGREVVEGDLLVVSEGDRVAADALLLSGVTISADESLLTGESVPVRKNPATGDPGERRPGGDDRPWLYSGTLVVQGTGVAEVVATGPRTEIGAIGEALQSVRREDTRLERETAGIVRDIALIGLGLCLVVVVVYGLTRGDWLNGLLAGIALAMAILPEEFPVVLTIFLALGAWRLSKKNVLTRRVPAIETLGSATVLCVDKTGTITENRMTVARLCAHGDEFDCISGTADVLPEPFHELLEFAILSSKRDPFDPMEQALHRLGGTDLSGTEHLHANWDLLQEYPLSPELLAMSNVWRSPSGGDYIIAVKGAPEAVFDLCHLDDGDTASPRAEAEELASGGYRVLGVAKAYFRQVDLPPVQHDFRFAFLGLVAFVDPVRPDAAAAVAECRTAGIRVAMITGDYPATARAIADAIGLDREGGVLTGAELEAMPTEQCLAAVEATSVFARVVPEQKLRIVESLEACGEVVAMTGDGVNDAPALRAADIGIAMGERGTDVAREAASVVLLDDNFASIVAGVRMGRRIHDNLRKAMAFIIAVHAPIAGLSLAPVLLGLPLILLPVHIVFLELIIDPACSVVFEAEREEPGIMQRPPRPPEERILDRHTVAIALAQGLVVLGTVLAIYGAGVWTGLGEASIRTLTFTAIVAANLSLIATNRSWTESILATLRRPNRAYWVVTAGALVFLAAALSVPFLAELFRFGPVAPVQLAVAVAAGVAGVLWFEVAKVLRHPRRKGAPAARAAPGERR
ncbi:MAG: cation-translocating P-type ATPase [Methanospirillum sp.]